MIPVEKALAIVLSRTPILPAEEIEFTEACGRMLREDVVERVLKRDTTALFGVRNVDDLERLFIYLCMHTGGILAHQSIAVTLGVSKMTVANHLQLLEQANRRLHRLLPQDDHLRLDLGRTGRGARPQSQPSDVPPA